MILDLSTFIKDYFFIHSFDCEEIIVDFIRSVYPILMKNAPEGELYDKVVKEEEKALMMSEVNLKPSTRGAFNSKKSIMI